MRKIAATQGTRNGFVSVMHNPSYMMSIDESIEYLKPIRPYFRGVKSLFHMDDPNKYENGRAPYYLVEAGEKRDFPPRLHLHYSRVLMNTATTRELWDLATKSFCATNPKPYASERTADGGTLIRVRALSNAPSPGKAAGFVKASYGKGFGRRFRDRITLIYAGVPRASLDGLPHPEGTTVIEQDRPWPPAFK